MKKTQNKGFTLVELIIVITILAILATIAFVSFSGYAGQSRDAKKQSELSNLKNKVEVAIAANSQDVMSFVVWNDDYKLNTIYFAWKTLNTTSTWYLAWTLNYSSIWSDASKYDFKYWIWVVKNNGGWYYQLATLLENNDIYTNWNYSPRTWVNLYTTVEWIVSWNKIIFSWNNIWKLRVWDTVLSRTNNPLDFPVERTIKKISSDLSSYEFEWPLWDSLNIFEIRDESPILLKKEVLDINYIKWF